jgi:gluconate 2-dehydrogenase alpha chain
VLLGAFTYENTRLLLLSASAAFPRGLANNHGQVGKHFAAHVTPVAFGVFPGRRLNLFNGLWSQATCLEDWNADNFDHAELGFVGGAMLTAPQEAKPIAVASGPVPPLVSRWGSEWKAWLHRHAQSIGSVVAQFDTVTYETNFLYLDPAVTDPHGVPVVRVTWELRDNERRGFDFMRERLHEWLLAAGAAQTWSPDGYAIEGRHCYGGTRMGNVPAMSVVDRHGLSHEVPNLGVLGASTCPTAGGSNPTLTVQALAWRTAQHVVNVWPAIVQTS